MNFSKNTSSIYQKWKSLDMGENNHDNSLII